MKGVVLGDLLQLVQPAEAEILQVQHKPLRNSATDRAEAIQLKDGCGGCFPALRVSKILPRLFGRRVFRDLKSIRHGAVS